MQEQVVDPVCVLRADGLRTEQFANPCFAAAAGVDLAKGDRLARGSCRPDCERRCNPLVGL
jgi:hypothetical protein